MLIRKPYAAGSFYPSDPAVLREFCKTHLTESSSKRKAKAIILPHAGYQYSGETACRVLSQIVIPDKILFIGPNHRSKGNEFAIYSEGEWETPLGSSAIASEIASALMKNSPDLQKDEHAHYAEHSLEVLLPFFQYLNPKLQIIPILIGSVDYEWAAEVAAGIGKAAAGRTDTLVVISNDMSHYYSDSVAREKDRYALDAILKLSADELAAQAAAHAISMCGIVPVTMLLKIKDLLGITKAALVDYRTSADATGEKDRVVGYAGFIFE